MLLKAVQLSYPYLFQILMIVKRPLTDNVTGKLHTTVTYMKCWGLRARHCLPLQKQMRGRIFQATT